MLHNEKGLTKETSMLPKVDLHTHTIASGHAFGTVNENVMEAAAKGLEVIGISDHGPAVPGAPNLVYFRCLGFLPRTLHGVTVLRGVEANIFHDGSIDLDERQLEHLDYVMAGLHGEAGYTGATADDHTRAIIAAMSNPRIRIITHPGNPRFPAHLEELARAAADTGTALELNNSSLTCARPGSSPRCHELARLCARFGTPVAIGSDAHTSQAVGVLDAALEMALEAGISWEQIVTRDRDAIFDFLRITP